MYLTDVRDREDAPQSSSQVDGKTLSSLSGRLKVKALNQPDDRGQQVGASDSAMLAFLGSVMQFAALG